MYLFILLLIIPFNAFATGMIDYGANFSARSFPSGASFKFTGGYGNLLWGENGDRKILYGYVRPTASFETIAVMNKATIAVDIFPISFFGFTIGRTYGMATAKRPLLNCSVINCKDLLSHTFINSQLALGAGRFFGVAQLGFDSISHRSKDSFFAEESGILYGKNSTDIQSNYNFVFGLNVNQESKLLAMTSMQSMKNTNAKFNMYLIAYQYKPSNWTYTVAAGASEVKSWTTRTSPTLISIISWNTPSIGLL